MKKSPRPSVIPGWLLALSLPAILLPAVVSPFSPMALVAEEAGGEVGSLTEPASTPEALLRKGDYEQAIEAFRTAVTSEEGASEGGGAQAKGPSPRRVGWAEALCATGKCEESLGVLKDAKGHEKSAPILCAIGRIHLRRGSLKEAESAFRAALDLDSGSVEAMNRLGEALSKQGNLREAKERWQKVVELYEEMSAEEAEKLRPEDFVEMGLALMGLNRFREAYEVMFSQARDKDEKNPSLLLEAGRILMEKYNYPDSRDELRPALNQNPRFADALVVYADNLLADFQLGTERYPQAEKKIEEALKVNPNHPEAHVVRGSLWLSDGNVEKAAEDFRKSLELNPSSLRARGFLAACHLLHSDEEALRAAEKDALAIHPKGAMFFHTIALAIENKFRYKDAVRYCERALELDPDYWPACATLAINSLRTGDEAKGRKYLEKSWENDKFNVWVYNTRLLLKHMDSEYRELKTDRFVFKFPKRDFDTLSTYLVPFIEEAFDRLSARYKTRLETPVRMELFSEHKWFSARTVGLEGFAAAGACFGNVVTLTTSKALPQNWGAVAWHEFAHVVTLAATGHRIPRWLTEGISVLEEGKDRPAWARNFEREIADTFGSGQLLPIAELDHGFSKPKYPGQVLISYFQGCLIAQYISEKWGFDAVLKMLSGYREEKSTQAIFKEVLGLSLEDFDREFFEHVARWVEKNGYEPSIRLDRIPALQQAVEADPKDVKKLLDLAWAYHVNGNDVDAPITAGKVLEIDPQNGDAHAILGFDAYRSKLTAKAKEELTKALELNTRFRFRVHSTMASILLKDGDKKGAVEHFEKAKEISPRAGATFPPGRNTYYQLAELYGALGDEEKAIAQMEELQQFAPDEAQCRARIVSHYMKKTDQASARKAFQTLEELLFINPFEKATHEHLARLAVKLGEHDATIREYGYLLKFPDTNPKVAYLALAKAHLAKGNAAEAASFAKKCLAIDAENVEAKEVLEKAGAPAKAESPEKAESPAEPETPGKPESPEKPETEADR